MKRRLWGVLVLMGMFAVAGCEEENIGDFSMITPGIDSTMNEVELPSESDELVATMVPELTQEPEPTAIPTQEVMITPEPVYYNFSVETEPEGAGSFSYGENGVYESGTEIRVVVHPKKGYSFDGWYDGEEKLDSARNIKFSLTKDTHLTAVFIAPTPTPMPSSIPYVLPYKVFSKTDIWDDIEKVSLAEAKAGTIVSFGNYEQDNDFKNGKEPIEWIVLEVRDGKAFLVSRYVLDAQMYSYWQPTATWYACELREWLNTEFYETAFTKKEREKVQLTHNVNEDNAKYGTDGGKDTEDYVFLLSVSETKHYFNEVFPQFILEFVENRTNKAWAARPTKYAYAKGAYSAHGLSVKGLYEYEEDNTEYFLRTPGKEARLASMVQPWLVVNEYGMNKTLTYVKRDGELIEVLGGVRPALWVDIAE